MPELQIQYTGGKWVKCFDWLNNKIVRKRLCKLVPIGHKVLIKFDERKIATELFDLTMMFGSNKNVPNLKDFKKAYDMPQYNYEQGEVIDEGH